MKFRTTIILFAVFMVLLFFLFLFESREKKKTTQQDKFVNIPLENVQEVLLKEGEEIIRFTKKDEDEWIIQEPLEAAADNYEVTRLAEDFCQLRLERVVEEQPEDLSKYGIPQKEITLKLKEPESSVEILIGDQNPLDNTLFAKRSDQDQVVLLPSRLKSLLEKELIDFRKKDIFSFETGEVKEILLESRPSHWKAKKDNEDWFLVEPFESLADKSTLSGLLYSLSSLKAKEFVVEEKNEIDLKKFSLDNPEFKITLIMPEQTKTITFFLTQNDEALYATTSFSPKIISTENTIVNDLEKPPQELREKSVLDFYTWETRKLYLKKGELDFTLRKDEDNNWLFDPSGETADKEKIESFIRKINSLEAEEFIDPPLKLKDFGLDPPQAELWLWTGEEEKDRKEIKLRIGETKKEENIVVVKNDHLNYLFRVKADFLEEFPGSLNDWKKTEPEEDEEEKQ